MNFSLVNEISSLLQEWDSKNGITQKYDPTPVLTRIADIIETERMIFMACHHRDPFDERHPSIIDPECALGHIISLIENQTNLISVLVNDYLRDTYFSLMKIKREVFRLNVAACRIMLHLKPDDILYGLLKMQPNYLLLKNQLLKWARASPEPLCTYATGLLAHALRSKTSYLDLEPYYRLAGDTVPLMLIRLHILRKQHYEAILRGELDINSGCIPIHPASNATKEMLLLRYLAELGEYRECLPHMKELEALGLIRGYLNARGPRNMHLVFEALRFLAALLRHTDVAIDVNKMYDLKTFLDVPVAFVAANGVSICLYRLASCEGVMERIRLLPEFMLANLVRYVMRLIEGPHDSGRHYAIETLGSIVVNRAILVEFDKQGGLRKLFNVKSTLSIVEKYKENAHVSDEERRELQRTDYRVCVAIRRYLATHLKLRAVEALRQRGVLMPEPSPLNRFIDNQRSIQDYIELLQGVSFAPIDELVELGGVALLLQVIDVFHDKNSRGSNEIVFSAIIALSVSCVDPRVPVLLTEPVNFPKTGVDLILHCCDNKTLDPLAQVAALDLLANCVCAPVHEVLIRLLYPGEITAKADLIRSIACRALTGLARSPDLRQHLAQHPLIAQQQLQALMCAPILHIKRLDHSLFQKTAKRLLQRLASPSNARFETSLDSTNQCTETNDQEISTISSEQGGSNEHRYSLGNVEDNKLNEGDKDEDFSDTSSSGISSVEDNVPKEDSSGSDTDEDVLQPQTPGTVSSAKDNIPNDDNDCSVNDSNAVRQDPSSTISSGGDCTICTANVISSSMPTPNSSSKIDTMLSFKLGIKTCMDNIMSDIKSAKSAIDNLLNDIRSDRNSNLIHHRTSSFNSNFVSTKTHIPRRVSAESSEYLLNHCHKTTSDVPKPGPSSADGFIFNVRPSVISKRSDNIDNLNVVAPSEAIYTNIDHRVNTSEEILKPENSNALLVSKLHPNLEKNLKLSAIPNQVNVSVTFPSDTDLTLQTTEITCNENYVEINACTDDLNTTNLTTIGNIEYEDNHSLAVSARQEILLNGTEITQSPSFIIDTIPNLSEPSTSENQLKRKRKCNKDNWIDHKNKKLKNSGEAYVGCRSKKSYPAKMMGPVCSCTKKCGEKFDYQQRLSLFTNFYKLQSHELKWEYIAEHVASIPVKRIKLERKHNRTQTHQYSFPLEGRDISVCKKYFLNTLKISDQLVYTALDKNKDQSLIDGRGTHLNRPHKIHDAIKATVMEHIDLFPTIESSYVKNSSQQYLSGNLNVSKMYRLYNTWFARLGRATPPATKRQYETIFNTEYDYAFFKSKKDSICAICSLYEKTGTKSDFLEENYRAHVKRNNEVCKIKEKENDSVDSTQTTIADIDLGKVFSVPQSEEDTFHYKRKYPVYSFIVFDSVNKWGHCYFWHLSIAKRGTTEIGSCLLQFLQHEAQKGIKHISLYSSCCAGRNKKARIFATYVYALKTFSLASITHRLLETGHSQGNNMHACIDRAMKNKVLFTPDQVYSAISNSKVPGEKFSFKEMEQSDFYDIKSLISGKKWGNDSKRRAISWSKIVEAKVSHARPHVLLLKYDFDDEYFELDTEQYIVKPRRGRSKRHVKPTAVNILKQIYNHPLPINKPLYDDLLELCASEAIPKYYHGFYKSLVSANPERKNSDESDRSDSDDTAM